ncbi:hypothetical protein A3A66_00890 [Microgenomates group bacterium RIFCSPLOWO2_01_FULL_46_13]|nr:MAG: hypothetical protein A2783_02975 [Microgenomates group bacterium RIFCSPHIGHO2_01_FULL_45_11]OGV94563.1 MAG: hypothetical protein A3A66_00890 [Microgenomates group bacterium RIFCSPLOWO2_01_FULL_46_13]
MEIYCIDKSEMIISYSEKEERQLNQKSIATKGLELFNPKNWRIKPRLNGLTLDQFHYISEINAWIAKDFKHGTNLRLGLGCIIEPDVKIGNNATIGHRCIIKSDVKVGNNLVLGDEVLLASGTRFANRVNIERRSLTTGICYMGDNSQLRANSTLSKGWVVEADVFIGAGVMTSHSLRPWIGRTIEHQQDFSFVGRGAWLGSMSQYAADVRIAAGVVVGYHANVVKDLDTANGVYFNRPYPWATLQKVLRKGDELYYPIPKGYQQSYDLLKYFSKVEISKYLPQYKGSRSHRV